MLKAGDVCLIYVNDIPNGFIRINEIEPDEKDGWHVVTFVSLEIPIKITTWKLDDSHVRGELIYMNGVPIRIQVFPMPKSKKVEKNKEVSDQPKAKVISMADWKANKVVKEIPNIVA